MSESQEVRFHRNVDGESGHCGLSIDVEVRNGDIWSLNVSRMGHGRWPGIGELVDLIESTVEVK